MGARVGVGPPEVAVADSAARRRCHGRGAEMGGCCTREALADYGYPTAAESGTHRRHSRQCHGRRKHYLTALRVYFPEYARELAETASFAALPGCGAPRHHARIARPDWQSASRDHRRHHARRTGQLHRRPHCQLLQLPRPQLRVRRGLRLGDGGDQRGDRGIDRGRF